MIDKKHKDVFKAWREDWNKFARDVLKAQLDKEQQDILSAVQQYPRVAVASGTSRGKDFVSAVASLCFLYLTPKFDNQGDLIANTKVAMTAPTDRQVKNIMVPEIKRLYRNAKILPGRMVAYDIRTDFEEWFLTGFKADDNATESWSGFHAVNTMFVVTEATGLSEEVFNAIEGNLQGNSRLLIVFNPNITTGYAARAMKSERFKKFRLNSLNAENVTSKEVIIPGQVDYEWVKDKVESWSTVIQRDEVEQGEGDFVFENRFYRPNDLFRVKVLGMFPKVSEDILIPYEWVELANNRWKDLNESGFIPHGKIRIGQDVAGMGRDNSVKCKRQEDYVFEFHEHHSGGVADHMNVAGKLVQDLKDKKNTLALIDTIGEGAGVLSRLHELGYKNAISAKASEGAKGFYDITGEYEFANMRAYMFWALRDWLNPKNEFGACLPPNDRLIEELTEIHWKFQSNGNIIIEPKEEIKKRLGRSPDLSDSLALTFYPHKVIKPFDERLLLDKLL